MYHGNNPKALTSQKLLLESFKELLSERDYKDFSVSELCDRSGVSRQTFYSLFETKENLLLYYLDLVNNTKSNDPEETVTKLDDICDRYATYVISNYKLLKMLMENNLSEALYKMFSSTMSACKHSFINLDQREYDYAVEYMSSGLCRLTQKYILEHDVPNHKELSNISYKIMSGNIYSK